MKWTVLKSAATFGAVLMCASAAQADDYAKMAPADQYMMAPADEIALAKSAAPPSISDNATVLVLTPHGYDTAIKGSNGFVCAVERSWMSNYDFPQFWNPHMRGPLCYNPAAVRTILPYTIKRTELVLTGRSKSEMSAEIKDGIEKHTLPPLEAGALTFMMSKQQFLNDHAHNWMPHLMFYFPRAAGASWSADMAGSPTMLNPQFQESPEAISVIMVPAPQWSDGTPAPTMR